MPPPLLKLADEAAYRAQFIADYCGAPVMTHDGIPVYFDRTKFNHAFFESVNVPDDTFSLVRAERMGWIKLTLQDATADRFQGWNKKTKSYEPHRRVEVVHENFVTVLQISRKRNGQLRPNSSPASKQTTALVAYGNPSLEQAGLRKCALTGMVGRWFATLAQRPKPR